MALVNCPDCAAQISDVAPACPKCGRPMRGTLGRAKATVVRQQTSTVTMGCAIMIGLAVLVLVIKALARLATP